MLIIRYAFVPIQGPLLDILFLKWGALSFKLSVLKETHIWTPFNVKICLDDALLFQNKDPKIK